MRRYLKNVDRKFRELERRYYAGDPDAFVPYILALRSKAHGRWLEAANIVRQRMLGSGDWAPWPSFVGADGIRSLAAARRENDNNFALASLSEDMPIAAPFLLVEAESADGDTETLSFEDGPYVVSIDEGDHELTARSKGSES